MVKSPSETYTIEQFIKSGNVDVITYANLTLYGVINKNHQFAVYNVLNDYISELINISLTVTLSDLELAKYKYKPKLLAYDLYGSTELYFIILALNGICDVKDFNMRNIKLLKKDDLQNVISTIYNSETQALQQNRTNVQREM